jgi:NitT/TauT family transport system substrate-binding protein
MKGRWIFVCMSLCLVLAACAPASTPVATNAVATSSAAAVTSAPVAQSDMAVVRIATEPWIGYGPWWIAKEKGLFAKYGLQAELVDFVQDSDVNAALASNKMDVANLATHTTLKLYSVGLDLRLVLLEDASYQADSILAGSDVKGISDLKGKSVAYEEGTTSDLLLNYALMKNQMGIKDIQPVPMPAADAGSALISGKVAVAVTYEPYITEALSQNKNLKRLYAGSERPGLISDVLVARADFAKKQPETIKKLLQVWDAALAYYKSNPDDAKAIIATAVGSKPEELKSAFDGVKYFDLADNRMQMKGDFLKTIQDVADVSTKIGLFEQVPNINQLIDTSFLGQ